MSKEKIVVDLSFWQDPRLINYDLLASQIDGVFYGGTNAYAMNNGSVLTVATRWEIGSTAFNTSIDFFTDMGTGDWNASGTKRIRCNFMYELA